MDENEGVGVDRCNNHFLQNLEDEEHQVMRMGHQRHSSDRLKSGVEVKLLTPVVERKKTYFPLKHAQ